jgi:hypothetical protein
MQQLTPEHFQAAEGAGGEDTVESLVRDVIPREIISRHAMQLGGGNVDLGKAILDSHLKQNPMHTGENLESVLRRVLKANIATTQDSHLKKTLGGLGDFRGTEQPPRLTREDMMKLIQGAGTNGPSINAGQAQASPEPGPISRGGYPKTGRFENMRPVLDSLIKEALPAPLGKAVEFFRGGPAAHVDDVQKNMGVNRFLTSEGKDFQFNPDTFHSVLMGDPSVQRMARGIGPDVMSQMGRAAKPGIFFGPLSRAFQRHVMGRGSHVDAASQALRNIAAATGYTGGDRGEMSQHFQTMTGVPGGHVGDYIGRELMGATKPSGGGQVSDLFGMPGSGGMQLNSTSLQRLMDMFAMMNNRKPSMGA